MASPRSDAAHSWQTGVSNENRTALVTELYNELMRHENDREAAHVRVRVWVAAANAELTLWRTSPDKESYVAGVRLKVAQWSAELDAYGPQQWAMDFAAQPVSPIDHLVDTTSGNTGASPFHDSVQAPAPSHYDEHDRAFRPPLTLKEQTQIAQHLALLDKQNLEIVALYQRHFNEIQRLVNSQVVNCASSEEREYQKQELQREQEGARLQLQRFHELQQRQLIAQPAAGLERYLLVRSPSVDGHDSMLSMMMQQSLPTQLVATAEIAAPDKASSASPSELVLSPLTISHNDGFGDAAHAGSDNLGADNLTDWTKTPRNVDGTDDDMLTAMTFLPFTPPTASEVGNLGLSPVAEGYSALETPSSVVLYSSKVSMLSPGDYAGVRAGGNGNGSSGSNSAHQAPQVLSVPVVIDLTAGTDNPENESSSSSEGARRTTVNEALRLYYTSRVTELRLEYQADLVALYRELRQMLKASDEDAQARKIEALMIDIKKILVVLTRSIRNEPVADEHVEELDHVEAYIQRRVHPLSQRLKVKQAIFGDQHRGPVAAVRTAQRQWQRFLRRMRDQQQQSPSSALPVNVSPPRRLGM